MPRKPIDPHWRERVRLLVAGVASGERLSSRAIGRLLQEEAEQLGRDDWPSERSVGRIRDEYEKLPEAVRQEYRLFHWPESMENRSVPWEASEAAFELAREAKGWRAPVRLVKWFWRVTVAAPDAPFTGRMTAAKALAEAEFLPDAGSAAVSRWAEGYLTYAPWRSPQAWTAYREALEAGDPPHLSFHGITVRPDSVEEAEFLAIWNWPHSMGGKR